MKTTSDSDGALHEVERQLDGLPRLPSHLDFAQHYSADHHCPVCSLGDQGGEHKPGLPSHAAASMAAALHLPRLRAIEKHGLALLRSLPRGAHSPSWWGKRWADEQAGSALCCYAACLCLSASCCHPVPHNPPPLQRELGRLLESSATHYCIIGLTLLDLAVVATELILSSIYACHEHVPHAGAPQRCSARYGAAAGPPASVAPQAAARLCTPQCTPRRRHCGGPAYPSCASSRRSCWRAWRCLASPTSVQAGEFTGGRQSGRLCRLPRCSALAHATPLPGARLV